MPQNAAVLLCGFLTLFMGTTVVPVSAQKGKTIFGENKRETIKAMKGIAQSLGVKCLYCHTKEGGKIKYEVNTPHKKLARSMKYSFVDSLVHKGQGQVEIAEEDHKTMVKAIYHAKGDSAGIHLTATTAAGKTLQKTMPLPEEGAGITCMTCHNGKVHFLTEEGEKK